jgi:putative membrane-bound dehydrogenase-like protein
MIRALLVLLGLMGLSATYIALAQSPASPPAFPEPHDTEPPASGLPLPAEEAAKRFELPQGFQVTVFSSEPDVRNPIAMAWDGRGRLWVAENYTYADRSTVFDLSLRDRVVIFEDKDGDGKHDDRKVFSDDLQMLTSVEIGRGGVWLMTPPQLIFIPDRDGDDKPDGAPEVVLDGFTPSRDNYHTFANGLKWGPDGWLYGRCGASSPGRIGVPGTPDAERIPLHGGIWRYHTEHKIFEVLCHGTTNPWGHDWDSSGQGFFVNTVNGHLWQIIPGAHYMRPHSEDPNPYVYEMIDTHADHYHWDTGKHWSDSRNPTGKHDELGGGHAHSGLLCYQGGNWPSEYNESLLMLNLHGRRVNVDMIDRHGAGNQIQHGPDILKSADPWFRGIDLSSGPDGSVFILDWSDTGECHDTTGIHRSSGRIYKVSYGTPKKVEPFDMRKMTNDQLIELHLKHCHLEKNENNWYVRQARQELMSRRIAIANHPTQARLVLEKLFEAIRCDVSWIDRFQTAAAMGLVSPSEHYQKLTEPHSEHVWDTALAGLYDLAPLDTIHGKRPARTNLPSEVADIAWKTVQLQMKSEGGFSGGNRLLLASILQRLPHEKRLELARHLVKDPKDADDHNLPLMVWYGLMPLADTDPQGLAEFAAGCSFPTTRRLIARRLAEMIETQPGPIDTLLSKSLTDSALLGDVLQGMEEAFAGRYKLTAPPSWAKVAALDTSEIRERVQRLSLIFGDGRALSELTAIVRDGKAPLAQRKSALATLISQKPANLREVCEEVLNVRSLNTVAVGGLTQFDDVALGEKLARNYRTFYPIERPALIEALTARPSFARALLKQIRDGKIPRTDLSAAQARQIRGFGDEALTRDLTEVWGELRDSPADKQAAIDSWKAKLTPEALAKANPSQGRAVFQKTCANCHRLYGHGGTIGPDLTGSGRANLDYLLLNMVDPNATVGAEYRTAVIAMKDGRVLNGIVTTRNDRTLTLQTAQDRITLSRSDIEELKPQSTSLMPDGQLQTLSDEQVRDLVNYLQGSVQVPLPE